jgi:integrase
MARSSGLRELVNQLVREAVTAELRGSAPSPLAITVSTYAGLWLTQRRQLKLVSVEDDETRLRRYVLPLIGTLPACEVRPRHIRDIVTGLRLEGRLAPRTQRRVYAAMSGMFRTMVADEVIALSPCHLRRGDLPPDVDSKRFVRSLAIFSLAEAERVVSAPAIPFERRLLYLWKLLTGCRHGEIKSLAFEQIETAEPLNRIRLEKTKTKRPRVVPIHPTLQWAFDVWRLRGWKERYGRPPTPSDLVLPDAGPAWKAQKQFLRDLAALGLRHRRGHDFRRTMITTYRALPDARDEMLTVITHGPPKSVREDYTSWPWPVLCAEILKLQFGVQALAAAQLAFAFPPVASSQQHRASPRRRVTK